MPARRFEACDGLQRQVLGVLVAAHHALDDEAREEMPHAMRRQRVAPAVERSKREKEAREHPITKHVLQTFGASIKEIKTDV